MKNIHRIIMLALLAVPVAMMGCSRKPAEININHYLESPRSIQKLRRVVLVEMSEDVQSPGVPKDLSFAILKSFQSRGLFHVTVLRHDDPRRAELKLDNPQRLTMDDLVAIRQSLQCDAVLYGRIVDVSFFPHSQVSLYLSLVDLRRARMVWGLDNTWDSRDKTISRRMKDYSQARIDNGDAPVDAEMTRMSPKLFNRFIAYEIAQTLDKPSLRENRKARSIALEDILPINN